MIKQFKVYKGIDGKFRTTEKEQPTGTAFGGVYDTPTEAFYYGLKFLDKNCKTAFVIEYL